MGCCPWRRRYVHVAVERMKLNPRDKLTFYAMLCYVTGEPRAKAAGVC